MSPKLYKDAVEQRGFDDEQKQKKLQGDDEGLPQGESSATGLEKDFSRLAQGEERAFTEITPTGKSF